MTEFTLLHVLLLGLFWTTVIESLKFVCDNAEHEKRQAKGSGVSYPS